MSHYHFFWQEQNQIFLPTYTWIATYFSKPAWLACLAGEYLTQYYYYKWLGPAILAAALLLTALLAYKAVRGIAPRWCSLALAVAAGAWIAACSLSPGYLLQSVLCLTGALALFLPVKALSRRRWTLLAGIAGIPLCYWMWGYGCFVYTLLWTALLWRRGAALPAAARAALTACALALALAFPAALAGLYTLPYGKALAYPGVGRPAAYDSEWAATEAVECEYYFGNHDKALRLALDGEPNVVKGFYYYLIHARRDSLPDYLLTYPIADIGTLNTIGEQTPIPVINMMNDLYYETGDMMYAERAAMMRNVFSPQNRNVRMIKRLAEANLVSGDTLAALKYLRILSKMPAYRQWAADHTPGTMAPAVEREVERRRECTNRMPDLRLGDNFRQVLLQLLESNPRNTVALDYLLCTDLLLKQIDTFKMDYDRYCLTQGGHRLKPLYQQALMIYLAGTGASADDWDRYIVMEREKERFSRYSGQRGSKDFAGTYWYYFDTHK